MTATCLTTGFPTKDQTSETTVGNLFCLFPHIHDSINLCYSLPNELISHFMTLSGTEDLI